MLKLANVFSNHMVLQRDKNIAVWGECDQTKVTGECNGKKVTTSVEDGRFMLYFPPMEAGGPYDMKITCDGAEVAYHDIMMLKLLSMKILVIIMLLINRLKVKS